MADSSLRSSKHKIEMMPSLMQKISMAAGSRRKQNNKNEEIHPRDTPRNGQQSGLVVSAKHQPEEETRSDDNASQASSNSAVKRRYTITSRHKAPASEENSRNGKYPVATETSSRDNRAQHDRESNHATPVADSVDRRNQSSGINVPVVGDDFQSRLEELKQFKAWSERIRLGKEQQPEPIGRPNADSSRYPVAPEHVDVFHDLAMHNQPMSYQRPIGGNHDLPLRHEADIVETNIEAPTPFSTPQVTPIPIKKSDLTQDGTSSVCAAASPPGFNLHEPTAADDGRSGRPRTMSRTMVIGSTPPKELEKMSSSRSQSRSRAPVQAPSHASHKDKKYPPVSFPQNFNEMYAEQTATAARNQPTIVVNARNKIPSVSPHTRQTPRNEKKETTQQQPPATPHDKRGRPTFYSTIHYFTECSHASPPAHRPLDPDAQPRTHPDFHPSNPPITRSIIPGMCFNCDTSYRRTQENAVIEGSTRRIVKLNEELSDLLDQLEMLDYASSSDDEERFSTDRHGAGLVTMCKFPEDEHDLRHEISTLSLPPISDDDLLPRASRKSKRTAEQLSYQTRTMAQIREIETAINDLRSEQDRKVTSVWRGFTSRWGPATLGVQRAGQMSDVHSEPTAEHVAQRATAAEGVDIGNLRIRDGSPNDVQVVRVTNQLGDDEDDGVSTASLAGSTLVGRGGVIDKTSPPRTRSVSRGRSSVTNKSRTSSASRTASVLSHRDVPRSRTPGEGRMKVGWIREDK
ncbi:hypothetical protein LTR05_003006 [Lithohypha guttulata]|uniref:Uncharacterized protein n=1 Tax=Lithohypha guttulata TaxID=1690604 RepID=A0AAN7YJJ1_9EURO|nr:hypothetical protein LTR05_003006 [Lithohypha guttulata]